MGLLGLPWATVANEQPIGFHCYGATGANLGLLLPTSKSLDFCFGATGATLGLPLPTSKPLNFIAMGLLGLPWGYLCQRANHLISLLWGYWDYLGATFATEQIIGFHGFGAAGATLGLPLLTSKSLHFIAMGLLVLPWGYLYQRANPLISLIWGYWS